MAGIRRLDVIGRPSEVEECPTVLAGDPGAVLCAVGAVVTSTLPRATLNSEVCDDQTDSQEAQNHR
jgi:hypothetical protein